MILPANKQVIFDYIWQPLVFIRDTEIAFLVNPGTTQKPIILKTGWKWHWPLLTAIRVMRGDRITFNFDTRRAGSLYHDEPITAVSRDHHLFSVQGSIELSIDLDAPSSTLSKLNRHTIKRVMRPTIRQSLRQAVAELDSAHVNPQEVSINFLAVSRSLFALHGLKVHHIEITKLDDFQPFITQKPRS